MEDLAETANKIMQKGYIMSLATADRNGPWVADVIYFFNSKLEIYWISLTTARHSMAIEKNPKVAASITVSNRPNQKIMGLQMEGIAKRVGGSIIGLAKKHGVTKKRPLPTKKAEILGSGYSWYMLKPTRIDITDEGLWGLDKKILE